MTATDSRSLMSEKRKLRQQMQARRVQIPHTTAATASQAVARHFADHPILAFVDSFAGYASMRGEIDIMPVFEIMAKWKKTIALPCIRPDKNLLFREWSIGEPLVKSPIGNEEPLATNPAIIPALVLVPLLAFDGDGYRLGYGGGYYDRTIEAMRNFETPPLFIGVAYSAQEIDRVPSDDHDQPLDGILTELGVSMFR